MAIKNFFDYIAFPDKDKRQKISQEYFDTQKLILDIEPYLTLNNLSKTISAHILDSDGLFSIVNKDLREKVRRYNNDVFYLTLCILKMGNYYNLLNSTEGDDRKFNEILFRKAARYVCAEIFMYEEKIKNLMRHILNLDMQKTRQSKDLMKELQKKAPFNVYVQNFYATANSYFNNPAVKFVKDIRDNEIHNDSTLDEYTDVQKLGEGIIISCNPYHIVSNKELYDNIKQALEEQIVLKDALQEILDNHKI